MTTTRTATRGLEITDLSFAHDRRHYQLQDVSLRVNPGEVCCLLGPNGTGKTTLLRCLLGLLKAESGTVQVGGVEIGGLSSRQLAQRVAYVPQSTNVAFPFTTLDIAVMGRTPHLPITATPSRADRQKAADVLDEVGIGHLADRSFASLSGGERQLTLFARALVQEAPLLILDEPTAALDYGNAVRVLRLVRRLGRAGHTILMSTHQPDHALSFADRAVLLQNGQVAANGPPVDVITSERLSQLYEVPVHVVRTELHNADGHAMYTCLAAPEITHTDGAAT